MTQKSSEWTLDRIVRTAKEQLTALDSWLFHRPFSTVEQLSVLTKQEEEKGIELQKILDAKKALEDARKKNRNLQKDIKNVGKPEPKPEPTKPTKINMGGTRR